jgi:hypothetical protein
VAGLAALALTAGAAGAEPGSGRLPSGRPLRVVDATGKLVGRVIDALAIDTVTVRVRAAGRDLLLLASPDALGPSPGLGLAFETPDCSGSPWIPQPPPEFADLFLLAPVAAGEGTALFAGDGPVQMKVIGSAIDAFADPPVCAGVPPGPAVPVRSAVQVLDLADWQPPFRVR